MFACLFVIVGNTAPNCLIFAEYIVTAFEPDSKADGRLLKFVALAVITFICTMHIFSRTVGILTNNRSHTHFYPCISFDTNPSLVLALYKVAFLSFVCITGLAVLGGARVGGKHEGDPYGTENFKNAFHQQTKTTPYSYAKSMLSIIFAFRGWCATLSIEAALDQC